MTPIVEAWVDAFNSSGQAHVPPPASHPQWVAPTEAGEAIEIRVVGMDLCVVFYSKGGNVSIISDISARPSVLHRLLEKSEMSGTRVQSVNVLMGEPAVHCLNSLVGGHRLPGNSGTGQNTNKADGNNPRNTD